MTTDRQVQFLSQSQPCRYHTKTAVVAWQTLTNPFLQFSPSVLVTMAVLSLRHLKALVLAGASQLPLATAQTVVSDNGVVLAASPITVVPAAKLVNVPSLVGPVEPAFATQLTDAVLANLTAHALTGVELFRFGDGPARGKRVRRDGTGPVCKTFPGDSDYPSRPIWAIFDLLTGGALIKTVPIGAVCYPNHDAFNPEKCQALIAGWATSEIQWVFFVSASLTSILIIL